MPRSGPSRCRRRAAVFFIASLVLAFVSTSCDQPPPEQLESSPFAPADSLRNEGRLIEAAPHYEALADSFAAHADTANLWRARLWWSAGLRRAGKLDSAAAVLEAADALVQGNPKREGWTRWVRSVLLDRQGRFDEALFEAERTLELALQIDDLELEAAAYNALGRIYSLSARNREALDVHERLLELRRRAGLTQEVARALNEIGIDYRHLGRFEAAARAYEEALGIHEQNGNPEGQAIVLYNLANIHLDTGEMEEALRLFRKSLRIAEEIQHTYGLTLLHNSLAGIFLEASNLDSARTHVTESLAITERAGLAYGAVVAHEISGRIELASGRLDRAAATLTTALALADSGSFGRERASVRVALARLATAEGAGEVAVRWANAATAIADEQDDPDAQYEGLEAQGLALEAAGDSSAALQAFTRAIELLESWRGRLALGDLRMGVAQPRWNAYEGAIRILVAAGRGAEAFEVSERARARLLLELMAERRLAADELSRIGQIKAELRERYNAAAAAPAELRLALNKEIERLTATLDSLETSEYQVAGAAAASRYTHPASTAEVIAGLTGPERVALAYFWGDRDVYGWWIASDGIRAARLGSSDSVSALIGFLRAGIEDPLSGRAWTSAARLAYQKLVAPLDPGPAEEIFALPAGPLAYLPLEVLIPNKEGMPWAATRRIVYGPSASVLLRLRGADGGRDWDRALLAVGDPDVRRAAAPPGGDGARVPLPPLPHAAAEARQLGKMFDSQGADVLTGRSATLDRWRDHSPGRYRYLHFAAHALVNDRRPDRTRIVLAGAPLDLTTVRNLSLNAELVTLSACETGLGRRVRGEGIIGLPHAFLAAGARGVLVSLWRISDRSAADFMERFYRELQMGRPPAQALARVRRALIDADAGIAHPSRWAAFVLVGGVDGEPRLATELPSRAAG